MDSDSREAALVSALQRGNADDERLCLLVELRPTPAELDELVATQWQTCKSSIDHTFDRADPDHPVAQGWAERTRAPVDQEQAAQWAQSVGDSLLTYHEAALSVYARARAVMQNDRFQRDPGEPFGQ